MYVNPFWYGVVVTLLVELGTMFIASLVIIWRANR